MKPIFIKTQKKEAFVNHSQGHVGHHGGSRHQGGVNQVVAEIIYSHVLHHFGLVFDGKSIKNDFKYLRN